MRVYNLKAAKPIQIDDDLAATIYINAQLKPESYSYLEWNNIINSIIEEQLKDKVLSGSIVFDINLKYNLFKGDIELEEQLYTYFVNNLIRYLIKVKNKKDTVDCRLSVDTEDINVPKIALLLLLNTELDIDNINIIWHWNTEQRLIW